MKKELEKVQELGFSPCDQVGHYEPVPDVLQIDKINILSQARISVDGETLEALASNICHIGGLLEPIIVANYDTDLCRKYLSLTNKICLSNHRISDLISIKINGENRFFIVISGERRLRSHCLIIIAAKKENRDCTVCPKKDSCFIRNLIEKNQSNALL